MRKQSGPSVVARKGETDVLKGHLVRALADYDNLVKRVEREKNEFERSANIKLAIKLLPVLDILREAQKHLGDAGVAITIGEFEDALGSEGIEEIKVEKGEKFNPQNPEAVETIPGGNKGTIAELVLSGWRFKDGKIIRHAKVKVFGAQKETMKGESA